MKPTERINDYIMHFLEVPHPVFQGLPPCPFARKERADNKIQYYQTSISVIGPSSDLLQAIRDFDQNKNMTTFLAFDVHTSITVEEAYDFAMNVTNALAHIEMLAIPLHPEDPFAVNGVRTRQGPYVMMLIQRRSILDDAKQKLLRTSYYQNWEDRDQRMLAVVDQLCADRDVFFPAIWWTDEVVRQLQVGKEAPEPVFGATARDLSINEVHRWMHKWGSLYGWKPFCPLRREHQQKMMDKVAQGRQLIITAHGGISSGLVAFLLPTEADTAVPFSLPNHIPLSAVDWYEEHWPGGAYCWIYMDEEEEE